MPVASVGPVHLPDVRMESWLIKFGKSGECTSPLTRQALIERLGNAGDTPVIVFSHGWNNDFDDATSLYRRFLQQVQAHIDTHNPAMKLPLFVGVLWPSIWLSFDEGLNIAAAAGAGEQELLRELAEALPSSSERIRFEALMESPAIDEAEVGELAALLQRALARSTSPTGALVEDGGQPTVADIEAAFDALPHTTTYASDDDDDLPPAGLIGSGGAAPARPAGILKFFDPRNALRVASVYQMKDRAGTVGARGVSALLSDILDTAQGKVHLVGHSYGCKVVLSALAAATTTEKATSALLLQPAISHLAFAGRVPTTDRPGGYMGTMARIEKSLLMTYSAKDSALHDLFHLALRRNVDLGEYGIAGTGEPPSLYAALGGYGPRQSGEKLHPSLPEPGQPFDLPREPKPVAFDGSNGQVNNHGDVATPYTAWLMYLQLRS
jgi:pimeloyl-ACP methyl ester carboxylesterase